VLGSCLQAEGRSRGCRSRRAAGRSLPSAGRSRPSGGRTLLSAVEAVQSSKGIDACRSRCEESLRPRPVQALASCATHSTGGRSRRVGGRVSCGQQQPHVFRHIVFLAFGIRIYLVRRRAERHCGPPWVNSFSRKTPVREADCCHRLRDKRFLLYDLL